MKDWQDEERVPRYIDWPKRSQTSHARRKLVYVVALIAALIIAALYHFFRWTTAISAQELIPPDPWIQQSGFQLERRQFLSCGLLHTDVWKKVR